MLAIGTPSGVRPSPHARARRIAAAAAIETRTKIYLDTNFWIQLRKAENGIGPPAAVRLLTALRDGVVAGRLLCPLSESAFIELFNQQDLQTRRATAQLMDELSLGYCLADPETRMATEVAHYFHERLGRDVHSLDALVWSKASYALGVLHPVPPEFVPPDVALAIQKGVFDETWEASLTMIVDTIGESPNADRFPTIAIKNGVNVDRGHCLDRAYGFLTAGTEMQKQAAINALGQVPLHDDPDWARWLKAFAALVAASESDSTCSVILTAIARRLADASEKYRDALADLGIAIAQTLGDHVLDTVARTVAFDLDHIPDRLLEELLDALRHVKATNLGTIETLDFSLMKLVEKGQNERARVLLDHLIRRPGDPIDAEKFDPFWYKLAEIGGDVMDDWIVTWLLDGDYALCRALDDNLLSQVPTNGRWPSTSLAIRCAIQTIAISRARRSAPSSSRPVSWPRSWYRCCEPPRPGRRSRSSTCSSIRSCSTIPAWAKAI